MRRRNLIDIEGRRGVGVRGGLRKNSVYLLLYF